MDDQLVPLLKEQELTEEMREKFLTIMTSGPAVTDYLVDLTEEERLMLEKVVAKWQYVLLQKQREMDFLLTRLDYNNNNNVVHEYNHMVIHGYIDKHLKEKKTMPSIRKIADATGLHRQTIVRHMQDDLNNEADMLHTYNYLAKDVMGTVLHNARENGDMRAAKLYLDNTERMMNRVKRGNYITINGFVITQEMAEGLLYFQAEKIVEQWTGAGKRKQREEEYFGKNKKKEDTNLY